MLYESFYSSKHLSMHLRLLCNFSFLNDLNNLNYFTAIKVACNNSSLCLLIRAALVVEGKRGDKHFPRQLYP